MLVTSTNTPGPELTSAERARITARSRDNARITRTHSRRTARRVKYTAQPFDPAALLADLHAEGIAR